MSFIHQSVRLLWPEDGEKMLKKIEYAARTCYRSTDRMRDGSAGPFVKNLIGRGHLSPLEQADLTVEIVTSRNVMAELTRHRLISPCVQSQRYVCYDKPEGVPFIVPYWAGKIGGLDNGAQYALWERAMESAEASYLALLRSGMRPQDARGVLPGDTATVLVVKANLREWRAILALRTSSAAFLPMRELMEVVLSLFQKAVPVVFDDIPPPVFT